MRPEWEVQVDDGVDGDGLGRDGLERMCLEGIKRRVSDEDWKD